MLYIGAVKGGPEITISKVGRRISSLLLLTENIRKPNLNETGSLNVVFHVSGSIISVDFSGLRTAKFSKKEKMLMIQVAVPEGLEDSMIDDFLITSLKHSATLAKPVFRKAKLEFDEKKYLQLVDEIAKQFK